MKSNSIVIALLIVAILAFVYFIIKRNRKDQKSLEKELNQREVKPEKHDDEHI
ncbi:MAG TPA: FeoB-associated Cys-rich membrane protein [Pedobacter sp.]|nr:FeoB-associated Cys-rich membrane protein [Pedobacter sp.]